MSGRVSLGLALGSGSARGLAHIGVIKVLAEAGVSLGPIAGTSIGAVVGALHLSGTLGEYEELVRGLSGRKILSFFDTVLPSSGLFGGSKLEAFLRSLLGERRIEELPASFCAIATDVETGEEVRLTDGDLVDALRASFSLPGIFVPQRIEDRWLVDGGVVAPVPIDAARALGADRVVAVCVQRGALPRSEAPVELEAEAEDDERERAGTLARLQKLAESPRLSPRVQRYLAELIRSGTDAGQSLADRAGALTARLSRDPERPPSLRYVLHASLLALQSRLTELVVAQGDADLVLEPKLPHIGLFDYDHAAEVIAAGERVAREALPRIEALLRG